jgi:hypothetical protein
MSNRGDRRSISSHLWDRRDWRAHLAEQLYQPLNATLPLPQPAHSLPAGFGLKDRRAEERSRQVDHLLDAYGLLPRRGR